MTLEAQSEDSGPPGEELTFGQWLKQRRKALDLTQERLAECVGCSLPTIEKIESGERRPSRQIAELLAECLNIAPHDRDAVISFARGDQTAYAVHLPGLA